MAKVLLVDDDDDVRYTIAKLLTRAGHDVVEAENGRVALDRIADDIAVVVSDLIMPEVEGVELFAKIKAARPDMPVIVISGGGRIGAAEYLSSVHAMGAEATFVKPLDEAAFLETVARLAG